jgi:sporulation protein YlmC with PRC-barrel domain
MIRKLMASSAMIALMTAGTFGVAQAQTEPAQTQEPAAIEQNQQPADQPADMQATETPDATTSTEAASSEEVLQPEEPTIATAFIGRSVFSSEDPESDNIGEVNDLIISQDGMITHAVVGVGGFLGIGEKNVAVPFDELEVVERDGDIRLVYAATREELEAAEEFDRAAYDPEDRFAEEQAAMAPDPNAPVDGVATPPLDTAATEQPAADGVTTEEESEAAGKNEAFAGDPNAEQNPPEGEVAMTEPAADSAAETPPAADAAATGTEPATDSEPADMAASETPAEAVDTAATDTGMAGTAGFLSFSADQVRASTLLGQTVYGPDEESIGEISDLVLQEDGETRAALIDVGGFLGVGEKEVAIPFEQIDFAQPAEEGAEPRVTVALSREELEQLPAWEGDDMADADMTADTDTAATDAVPDATQTQDQAATDTDATQPDAGAADVTVGEFEIASQDLTAEELLGSAVYGSNDENLGEVGDVIFDQGGSIEAVVVDVGGFLGIAEKPVAVEFDALNVQKGENGDLTLMLNASQEELEAAPSYEEQAAQ